MSVTQTHLDTQICSGRSVAVRRRAMVLADGTVLSVQASPHHFSTPRTTTGPHVEVEVRSNREIDGFTPYFDGRHGTRQLYAFVPVSEVDAEIKRCGGVVAVRGPDATS